MRGRLADHARRRPAVHVERGHEALEFRLEPLLQLGGARIARWRGPRRSGRARRTRRPDADPRCDKADNRRKPRFHPPPPARHRRRRSCVKAGICFCTNVTPLSERRAPPRPRKPAPRRFSRQTASPNALTPRPTARSSAWEPSTKNHLRHCFQTRYCASPSASMERVGATWTTLPRHFSSRKTSSLAPMLKISVRAASGEIGDLDQSFGGQVGQDEFGRPFRPVRQSHWRRLRPA